MKTKERVASALSRSGRGPADAVLVAVSKNRTVEEIRQAVVSGISELGENRVQEASEKFGVLPDLRWHLVGHLQTNKAKEAVRIFDLIHSVDSLHLALELDKQALRINKVQDILLEVNVSGEAAKFGIKPGECLDLAVRIAAMKNLRLLGLMTVAPLCDDPEASRPVFKGLRELRDALNSSGKLSGELVHLSMGMTGDFEVAIEEGSTLVRIGRAIFEG